MYTTDFFLSTSACLLHTGHNDCFGTHLLLALRKDLGLSRLERTRTFFWTTLVSRIRQAHELPDLVMLGNAIGRWDRSIAYNRLYASGSYTPSVDCRHAHDPIPYHLATVSAYTLQTRLV